MPSFSSSWTPLGRRRQELIIFCQFTGSNSHGVTILNLKSHLHTHASIERQINRKTQLELPPIPERLFSDIWQNFHPHFEPPPSRLHLWNAGDTPIEAASLQCSSRKSYLPCVPSFLLIALHVPLNKFSAPRAQNGISQVYYGPTATCVLDLGGL